MRNDHLKRNSEENRLGKSVGCRFLLPQRTGKLLSLSSAAINLGSIESARQVGQIASPSIVAPGWVAVGMREQQTLHSYVVGLGVDIVDGIDVLAMWRWRRFARLFLGGAMDIEVLQVAADTTRGTA